MRRRWWATLRLQLTVVGFAAIYGPVLVLAWVGVVTDEEVITSADGATIVTSSGARSPWTFLTLALLLPVAAGLAWWLSVRATRPIDQVREVADEIGESDLSRRIGLVRAPTEIVALAASFDAMLDRLEQASEVQRTLIEETSHELRTPLAVLTTTADVLLAHPHPTLDDHRAGLERTRAAATRLGGVVDALLVEARGRVRSIAHQPVDLASVVGDVVAEASVLAAQRDVRIAVSATSLVVPADEPTVRRAIANLVDNAIRHAPAGSAVDVEVAADEAADRAAVAVTDRGPGLAPEAQVTAFERFWRADDSPGSGLGLPIARQVARAHGGDVTVASPGRAGHGSTFVLTLPGR